MLIPKVSVFALLSYLMVAGPACGGSQPEAETPQAPPPPPPAPEPDALPDGHAWRYQVMEVMSPGLGAFLRRLDVKEKLVDGRFHGFQVMQLRGDPAFWEGSDIRVGDVVTRVNGGEIRHYDQAFKIWQSLATVNEIVIAYERRGEPREFRIIVHEDDESPASVAKVEASTEPKEPQPEPEPKPEPKPKPEKKAE